MDPIRLYRRPHPDLRRSGRIIIQIGDRWFDFTEYLWHQELPLFVTALCRRGWFEADRVEAWLESVSLPEAKPIDPEEGLLPPLLAAEVGKILALGKNFRAHAAEFSEEVPAEPLYFNKLPETLRGHLDIVSPPPGYEGRLDHEAELAVVIGQEARNVELDSAMACVAGYTVANDLTLRGYQAADREKKYPWFRAKNFDGACPLGPCFVPANQLGISDLKVSATVNGELRQEASTAELVVSVPAAISYLSRHLTLHPGDLILMGTPAGVGPLNDGDQVTCAVEGIGELTTRVERR